MFTRDASIADLFLELTAVPSPSGRELRLGEQIRTWLAAAGVAADFDAAGQSNGSDSGNLIATVPGDPAAAALLFVAHMDTVESGSDPIQPSLGSDGVIRSVSDTILGADNKSAVAAAMRLCVVTLALPAEGRPTVIVAFTCREESGRMGASLLDGSLLGRVDCAFSVDGSKPIGTVITRALGQSAFSVAVGGRAAHAAANPEAGLSAIRVAAEIVTALHLGRQAGGGSASVAAIVGGAVVDRLSPGAVGALDVPEDASGSETVSAALAATPTNSVPDAAWFRGEVRGYSVDEIEGAAAAIEAIVARVCDEHGARYEWTRGRTVPPLPAVPGSRALELVQAAAAEVRGVELITEDGHATLEANYLAAADIDVVALASGGRDPHQPSESITVSELEQLEALLVAIVRLGSRPGPA